MREVALNGTAVPADRPTDEEEERQLAAQAARGDRRAFAALYDRHLDAVYRYCFFRLRSEQDAEDVTSEVFHRALVAMPRYEPRRPFLAFLYTIGRNVIADRARRARPVATFDDAVATPAEAPGPEERSVALDEARGVREAIAQLTGLQQEVVILRFIEGRSTQEIAAALGKRESTIRGIQMRALAALRGILEARR